ncbi:N-acetyl-gamma-glutamyl-phosphate reductase, partial [Candidatus Woesearchaeota archaeon]|nr:N-acetyl-gamma-glutamyl-phosphate reductase [Candidatus Woesearchaeota archaeon]
KNHSGKPVKDLYPESESDLKFTGYSFNEINKMDLDCLFLALPDRVSSNVFKKLKAKKVIDLSSAHRSSKGWTYGLTEINSKNIKHSRLLANPGCYATAAILSAYPVKDVIDYAVFSGISGYSGAGKKPCLRNDPENLKKDILAYSLKDHKHQEEIGNIIGKRIGFTPHVAEFFRGIIITSHIILNKNISEKQILNIFKKFYSGSDFIEITESIPELKSVRNTNKCIIGGFKIDKHNRLVIVSVIDNLLKGAAGQAVQNMNLMLGFPQRKGVGLNGKKIMV